jgi:hypothetical protein
MITSEYDSTPCAVDAIFWRPSSLSMFWVSRAGDRRFVEVGIILAKRGICNCPTKTDVVCHTNMLADHRPSNQTTTSIEYQAKRHATCFNLIRTITTAPTRTFMACTRAKSRHLAVRPSARASSPASTVSHHTNPSFNRPVLCLAPTPSSARSKPGVKKLHQTSQLAAQPPTTTKQETDPSFLPPIPQPTHQSRSPYTRSNHTLSVGKYAPAGFRTVYHYTNVLEPF